MNEKNNNNMLHYIESRLKEIKFDEGCLNLSNRENALYISEKNALYEMVIIIKGLDDIATKSAIKRLIVELINEVNDENYCERDKWWPIHMIFFIEKAMKVVYGSC